VIVFPFCKINLGLRILAKRSDGYHDLESIFYPLPLKDALEIVPSETVALFQSGLKFPGRASDNLCLKAFSLIKTRFPDLTPVAIYLHKAIPAGAGLGGGSSDGARMLLLLNDHFRLELTPGQLFELALELGSDCPFFLQKEPALVRGRGERVDPIRADFSAYSFILIHPSVRISTAEAFSRITPRPSSDDLGAIIDQPVSGWRDRLVNDFEKPVFEQHPELAEIKRKLYDSGALYASLTGSGSTIYGIYEKSPRPVLDFGQDISVTFLK
jgi:4-diphosphocytidyl-2-C-methyl-D-erythritol kinase